MKSSRFFTAIAIIALAAGSHACAKTESGFVKTIERSARTASTNAHAVVTISTQTSFPWDKLYIFAPYTPIQRINDQLGFTWAEAGKTHIASLDTFYLLVFLKNGKVVEHFKWPRESGDFQLMEGHNLFTPGNDTFEVKSVRVGNAIRLNFLAKARDQPSVSSR